MAKHPSIMKIFLVTVLFAGLAHPVQGAGRRWSFHLKLSAGTGWLPGGGGDLETLRRDLNQKADDHAFASPFTTATWDWQPVSGYSDFRCELLLTSGRHLGLSLGIGSLAFSSQGEWSLFYDIYQSRGYQAFSIKSEDTYQHQFDVKAIPLDLKAYFFLPVGKRLSLYAFAGPEIVFGRFDHKFENRYNSVNKSFYFRPTLGSAREIKSQVRVTEEARGCALGFQGGMGFQLRLAPFVTVGLEASSRLANIKNWKGTGQLIHHSEKRDYSEDEGWSSPTIESGMKNQEGGWWYYIYRDPDWWDETTEIFILTDPPHGKDYIDVRRAGINLNSFRIGFVLMFHL